MNTQKHDVQYRKSGSFGKMLAVEARGPEFGPQYPQALGSEEEPTSKSKVKIKRERQLVSASGLTDVSTHMHTRIVFSYEAKEPRKSVSLE